MSDLQEIESTLESAARRRRRERAFRGFWQGLFAGALIWLLALAAYKVLPMPSWTLPAAGGVGLLAALIGLILHGGWRKNSVTDTARWVDGRQHLQERLSTALEMAKTKNAGSETWRELLVTDAISHLKEVDPRRLVQFRLPKISRWALLVLALAAGLGFVPEYRSKNYLQKQTDQKVIQETGRQLADLTKRAPCNARHALETTEKSMEAVNELGEQFTKKALTRNEALKDLAKVTDRLKDEMKEMGRDPALKRMEQAARSHAGDTSPENARLQKQIEDTQKQLGNPTGTPEDMDKLNKELNKMQEAAKAAADKNGGMSQSDKEKLSKSMAALAKQAREMGLQMPDLDQAIQALAANQTDMVLKDPGGRHHGSRQDARYGQEHAANAAADGKDGQGPRRTIEIRTTRGRPVHTAKDDQSVEVIQSLPAAASKNGFGSFQGRRSRRPIRQGRRVPEAGRQQVAARSEARRRASARPKPPKLDRLMQQMNDAQAMQAELDALNKASLCVGTCQSWSQCKGNKPGFGKGGKPGSGVGQWANEDDGWGYDGHQTQKWDNTGVTRPDTAPRGTSDRGDAELNDALRPDKVKGQFSPGGQMPSITLKGVSIKGQSKVALEESTVAAQADAQSALSQEKVPRAYQGAVREYFDDLKK